MSIQQQLRDRVNIDLWHDAGLLNNYTPNDVMQWQPLTKLLFDAANRIDALENAQITSHNKEDVIEEVAKAICKVSLRTTLDPEEGWEELNKWVEVNWQAYKQEAKAAIEAYEGFNK